MSNTHAHTWVSGSMYVSDDDVSEVAKSRPDVACDCGTTYLATVVPTGPRSLRVIAREIRDDWHNVNFAAAPYLDAMATLDTVADKYGYDDADDIVMYFLSNANTWRGETARRVKAELKTMVGIR